MVRSRLVFLLVGLALLIVSGARGRSQAPAPVSGIVVSYSALPPIDLGFAPYAWRSGDSRSRISFRVHPEGLTLDRVGRFGSHYMAGQVIVKFRDGGAAASRLSALSTISVRASSRPTYANFDVLTIGPDDDAEAVAQALSARSDVEYAQPAYRVRAEFTPNDPLYPKQWNLPDIDMERAWDIQPAAGSAITVAVLDTGIAYTNVTMQYVARAFKVDALGNINPSFGTQYPALGPLTLQFAPAPDLGPATRFVAPHDFIWEGVSNVPVDLDGHGTHVSGTIGQTTNNNLGTAGVAFNVKLMPLKVIDADWDIIFGAPNQGTDVVVARAIRYAVDNGAKIINMSIGRSSTDPSDKAPVVEDAIKYAVGKGVFVAIASGNEFEDGNPREVLADIASRVPGCVAVAATDRAHNRAFYSSTGGWVKLAAPGGAFLMQDAEEGIIQQTLDQVNAEAVFDIIHRVQIPPSQFRAPRFDTLGFWSFTGTSQATPHVSGLAAMLMQQGITDPVAIESALERFATSRGGTTGRNNEFGFGEINARNTLRGLGLAR